MAVFGPQLIYTIIMFVILAKLGKFYSFGRWLLCYNLFRYLSPNSDDLKKSVRNYYKSQNSKNKKLNRLFEIDDDKEEFNIPEGATVELSMSPVRPYDLFYIKYTDDFQSFVDVSCIAVIIYLTTEIYIAFFRPVDEINLSVVWCAMVIVYGLTALSSIAKNYLRTSEGALLFIFAGLSFILSLLIQLGDSKFFDFQLKDAFRNFSTSTINLIQSNMESQNVNSFNQKDSKISSKATTSQKIYSQIKTYTTNELLFSCFLALLSSIIGALLFFPSFRLARLHFLCLKYSSGSKLKRFVYYLNFLMPLLVSLCWFRTNFTLNYSSDQKLTNNTSDNSSETVKEFLNIVYKNDTNNTDFVRSLKDNFQIYFLNLIQANNLKIYLIIFIFVLRLTLYRHYAQSYLNLAYELAASIRRQSTKLTNVKYMSTISSIYQYYGVVASQYVLPVYILLFLVLLLKTLGGYSWCGDSIMCNDFVDSVANYTASFKQNVNASPNLLKKLETNHFNVTMGHDILNKIFSPFVLRSLIGYFTFWTCTIWFVISCFGLLYYQYIDRTLVLDQ